MSFLDRIRGAKSAKSFAPSGAPAKAADKPVKKIPKAARAEPILVAGDALRHPELIPMLRGPHISEKAAQGTSRGEYVFDVSLDAEKIAIRKAVEALYGVHVESVRTMRLSGKPVLRGRQAGARGDRKKAVVTLKKGETIALYEGV